MLKRFLSFFVAMAICLGMPCTAFAAEVSTNDVVDSNVTTANEDWATLEVPDETGSVVAPLTIGGTETWIGSDRSNEFTFYGNNLTPVKTIGQTGKLYLYVCFTNLGTPVKLRIQIRDADTQEVMDYRTIGPTDYYENDTTMIYPVEKGDRIQISFRVYDANGNYDDDRPLRIVYGYYIG